MKKENKGITLITLIITIIVLLILAVITISAVNEGNIFAHANNAATRWNAAATEENAIISNMSNKMDEYENRISGGYIEEPEVNVWQTVYGLTSSNAVYNVEYSGIILNSNSMTIALLSDGSIYGSDGSISASDIEYVRTEMPGVVFNVDSAGNFFTINYEPVSEGGEKYTLKYVIASSTTMELYRIDSDNPNEEIYLGTLSNVGGTVRTTL